MGPAHLPLAGPYSCKACSLRLFPTFKTLHVHLDNDKVLDFHQLTWKAQKFLNFADTSERGDRGEREGDFRFSPT
jgi:hypothetical protein